MIILLHSRPTAGCGNAMHAGRIIGIEFLKKEELLNFVLTIDLNYLSFNAIVSPFI